MKAMRFKLISGILIGLLFGYCLAARADKINSPPPFRDISPALQHYIRELYDNFHVLEVTTTNPDGARTGKKGATLHLQTGGKFYHCENTNGSTTWRCVELTDTP